MLCRKFELEDQVDQDEVEIEDEEEKEIIRLYGKYNNKNKHDREKGFSEKDCICGGHNAHNVKKNKNNNSTKKKLDIRKKRRARIEEKLKNLDEKI